MTRLQMWIQCPHCENLFKRTYYMTYHRQHCEKRRKRNRFLTPEQVESVPAPEVPIAPSQS